MVVQQRRALEPRFGREVLDHDRAAGSDREAGLRPADRRDVRAADQARLPADARAQQQLGIARHEFQDLDEFDVEHRGDDDGGVVKKCLEVGLRQRALAKPCDGLLLARAMAQFAVQFDAVGDVAAGAEHLGRLRRFP